MGMDSTTIDAMHAMEASSAAVSIAGASNSTAVHEVSLRYCCFLFSMWHRIGPPSIRALVNSLSQENITSSIDSGRQAGKTISGD
jgi:hypothetical protein